MDLWAWGSNSFGQLGIGEYSEQCNNPVKVILRPDVGVIKQVASGGAHSFLVNTDGKLFSTGWNVRGQLGLGEYIEKVDLFSPVPLPCDFEVESVACGWDFTIIITREGRVYGSGSNVYGQLGREIKYRSRTLFREFEDLRNKNIVKVACGMRHSVFLSKDGKVYVCGNAKRGQLGLASLTVFLVETPTLIQNIPPVIDVCAGQNHTVCLLANKLQILVFGDNKFGQLGYDVDTADATAIKVLAPKTIPLPRQVDKLECGWTHTVLLTSSDEVWTTGRNTYGQLGRSERSGGGFARVESLSDVATISSGYEHVLAVTKGGKLMAWGWNEHGNLGTGNTASAQVPVDVKIPCGLILQCFAGSGHSFALVS